MVLSDTEPRRANERSSLFTRVKPRPNGHEELRQRQAQEEADNVYASNRAAEEGCICLIITCILSFCIL